MTRKDYVRFAAMLKAQTFNTQSTNDGFQRGWRLQAVNIIHATADIFAADNASFNRARFLKACGVES